MAIVSATAIKTNIERIAEAKDEIISAITEKGGTVADGAKIEDLPACIRAIPTGGSGGGETATFDIKMSYRANIATAGGIKDPTAGDFTDGDTLEFAVGELVVIYCPLNARYVTVEGEGFEQVTVIGANGAPVAWILKITETVGYFDISRYDD